ncbi:hypothetical protein RBH26_05235 [Natronolimnohabitans sp. A-GB9]|uniref:hypothetical protein n=1 Tax=Natronolimnohabitans sp. A-GB9 TaxID=3069757 RepID=UPI0027B186AF|nr:hypothetical protein [Natronolimnohabitans sp. A-GB9]MDQ2049881.1 hypothetical protein [Natronolimnohabitans sp. A-GB9]
MNGLEDAPESVYRAIFLGIVFYFALLAYASISGDPLAALAAEFVFGVIAVGVGTVLYLQVEDVRRQSILLAASACLVVGGALQFAYLFTRVPTVDVASSFVVFVGIGCYVYAVWYAE